MGEPLSKLFLLESSTLSSVYSAKASKARANKRKQIIQIEHNIVKNPKWPLSNQLLIYKHGGGFELGVTMKQIRFIICRTRDRWNASPTR